MAGLTVRQNALQQFLQFVPASRIGAALFSKFLHILDRPLMRLSSDKVSIPQIVTGLPCVRLTSKGARTGRQRAIPTVGVPDGDNVALICSNWGQKHHPAWYFNLKKNPQALLEFDSHQGWYVAEEVTDKAEYDRLWRLAVQIYRGYPKYRERTGGRRIPIMLLRPATS